MGRPLYQRDAGPDRGDLTDPLYVRQGCADRRMPVDRPLRVLHCPSNIAGNPQSLAEAERSLGLSSKAVAFERHRFGYHSDAFLFEPSDPPLVREKKRWGFLRAIPGEYDVVHFNFGRTVLPQWLPYSKDQGPKATWWAMNRYRRSVEMRDLPYLKRRGLGIAMTYQGDDARQQDFVRKNFAINTSLGLGDDPVGARLDPHRRRRIRMVDRYADRIYALNPDLLHVLPERAEFVPYASVHPDEWRPVPWPKEEPPLVVHAPSHRGSKGTEDILRAVKQLEREGVPFRFRLIEGMTHAEARRLYEEGHLLVDQVLAGWYGGLAVEFMALGRPAMCYLREEDLDFLPEAMRDEIPLIRATPDDVADVLRVWLTDRKDELRARGEASRRYVERWHHPVRIAERMKRDYEEMVG